MLGSCVGRYSIPSIYKELLLDFFRKQLIYQALSIIIHSNSLSLNVTIVFVFLCHNTIVTYKKKNLLICTITFFIITFLINDQASFLVLGIWLLQKDSFNCQIISCHECVVSSHYAYMHHCNEYAWLHFRY